MIEANNLTKLEIDIKSIIKTVQKLLAKENKKKWEVSIALVRMGEMKKLNKKWRKKNKPTDVLSYIYGEKFGEVIICPQQVRKNAKKFGSTPKEELLKVLIHGVLHLLGYDHEQKERQAVKMQKKEKYYFNLFKK